MKYLAFAVLFCISTLSACAQSGSDGPERLSRDQSDAFIRADSAFWSTSSGRKTVSQLRDEFEAVRRVAPQACRSNGQWQGCLITLDSSFFGIIGNSGLLGNLGLMGLALHEDGTKCRSGMGRSVDGQRQTARIITLGGREYRNEAIRVTSRATLFEVCERLRLQE